MDQSLPFPGIPVGIILPTVVPNLKMLGGGIPSAPSGVPSIPGGPPGGVPATSNVPGSQALSGSGASPGLGAAHLAAPQGLKAMPGVGGAVGAASGGLAGAEAMAKVAKVPLKAVRARSPDPGHGNARLQPRQFHNADFSTAANPNATMPQAPTPSNSTAAAAQKRAFKNVHTDYTVHPPPVAPIPVNAAAEPSSVPTLKRALRLRSLEEPQFGSSSRAQRRDRPDIQRPDRPQHNAAPAQGPKSAPDIPSSSSSGPAAGMADVMKMVGTTPRQVASTALGGVPSLPDTPLTTADDHPTFDALPNSTDTKAVPKVPVPVSEKEPVPSANPGTYPNAPGFGPAPPAAQSKPKGKRNNMYIDTNALLGETREGADPNMALIGLDSNQKPDPSPDPVQSLAATHAAITPAPSSSAAAPTSSVSYYQPSEPGYQTIAYPTITPTHAR